jgi:hypothetical protein
MSSKSTQFHYAIGFVSCDVNRTSHRTIELDYLKRHLANGNVAIVLVDWFAGICCQVCDVGRDPASIPALASIGARKKEARRGLECCLAGGGV